MDSIWSQSFLTRNREAGSMGQRRHVDKNRDLSYAIAGFVDGRLLWVKGYGQSYKLNVSIPFKFICWNSIPSVKVLGGEVCGKSLRLDLVIRVRPSWWGECLHKKRIIIGVSPSSSFPSLSSSFSLFFYTPSKGHVRTSPGRQPSPSPHPCWHPNPRLPASKTVRNKCCLSHGYYSNML